MMWTRPRRPRRSGPLCRPSRRWSTEVAAARPRACFVAPAVRYRARPGRWGRSGRPRSSRVPSPRRKAATDLNENCCAAPAPNASADHCWSCSISAETVDELQWKLAYSSERILVVIAVLSCIPMCFDNSMCRRCWCSTVCRSVNIFMFDEHVTDITFSLPGSRRRSIQSCRLICPSSPLFAFLTQYYSNHIPAHYLLTF